tara:strand:+ start:631 stop:1152 length:522 start_codon:yes stop_codon:yes gene_type:complete
MTEQEKFKEICKLTTDILGLPENSLKQKSRIMQLSLGREIAGMIGLKNDISRDVISEAFNRNRTLTYYYERHHYARCDKKTGWPKYAKQYYKVLNAYRIKQNKKKVFLDKIMLRRHLQAAGLSHSSNPTIEFTIKSGDVFEKLLSDYSKFSIDYDTIKDVTKDYNCSLNWKEI